MMMRLPQFLFFLSLFLMVLALVDAHIKSIIIFGDSQNDAGNNAFNKNCTIQANFKPYGSKYFHHPTGRFTNGRTVADFICQYMNISFQKPYQEVHQELANGRNRFPDNGINFASAGSGLLRDTNRDDHVTPIQEQLQQFQALIDQKLLDKKQVMRSLIFMASGSNDIFSYFMLPGASGMTPQQYILALLKEVSLFVDKTYKVGARRFAFFPIGPLGCIPGRVIIRGAPTDRCMGEMDLMVDRYNAALALLVKSMPKKYPGAIGIYGEVANTVDKIRAYPKLYGFNNVSEACCGSGPLNGQLQCGYRDYKLCPNPDEYFFWDFFHPTQHVYMILSKILWAGNQKQIWPVNLKTLANHQQKA
ncbi:SGNH hydrolase-type esterase domain-containing protein [Artemisia annua]|uniref:SGNH hydrolase-type esterase domain-containing protein n=1 Tax=Artemisia annua TaxID=35608 RepID=A0A2U1KG88_ARTAN|nr:SGNH hydrolase-type esterase domain-containing protein [Artemisia annua]